MYLHSIRCSLYRAVVLSSTPRPSTRATQQFISLTTSSLPTSHFNSFSHVYKPYSTMSKEKPTKKDIKYVIFDMDGLLLDTEGTYTRITQAVVNPFGKEFTWDLKKQVMGRTSRDSAQHVIKTLDLPLDVDEYIRRMNEQAQIMFPSTPLLPGVERLVRHLKNQHVPIAVATSSGTDMFNLKTQNHHEVFSLFDIIVRGDDPAVKNSKPAPDIFLEAARRLGDAEPEKCLVFEDSALGVDAGHAANMTTIAIPDPRHDMTRFDHADRILKSMEEFDPAWYGLPGLKD